VLADKNADDQQNMLGDIKKVDRREAAAEKPKQASKALAVASARGDADSAKSGAGGQLTDRQLLTNVAKSRSRIC